MTTITSKARLGHIVTIRRDSKQRTIIALSAKLVHDMDLSAGYIGLDLSVDQQILTFIPSGPEYDRKPAWKLFSDGRKTTIGRIIAGPKRVLGMLPIGRYKVSHDRTDQFYITLRRRRSADVEPQE